jgi:hypothetical protein
MGGMTILPENPGHSSVFTLKMICFRAEFICKIKNDGGGLVRPGFRRFRGTYPENYRELAIVLL